MHQKQFKNMENKSKCIEIHTLALNGLQIWNQITGRLFLRVILIGYTARKIDCLFRANIYLFNYIVYQLYVMLCARLQDVAVNKPEWSPPKRVYSFPDTTNCDNDFFSTYCICDSCSIEETYKIPSNHILRSGDSQEAQSGRREVSNDFFEEQTFLT